MAEAKRNSASSGDENIGIKDKKDKKGEVIDRNEGGLL